MPVPRFICFTGTPRREASNGTLRPRRTCRSLGWFVMARDEILVAFYPGFREVAPNFALPVGDLLIGQAEVLGEVPVHFGHDLVCPFWEIESSPTRKAQQGVSQ
jgi:hypothetical protein